MIEFVAEIGSMHKGIKALAYEMIRQFSQAGATLIKGQLGHDPEDPIRYIDPWIKDLDAWCRSFGVEFFASIWSQEGLDAARSVDMKRYKIAHQKFGDEEFLDMILEDGKEVIISVPRGASLPTHLLDQKFKLLTVDTEYPSYTYRYSDIYDGYSSHMHGIADALMAIRDGALLVEKHCTLDKTEESIKDNAFAISPQEFADMVKYGKEIQRLIS